MLMMTVTRACREKRACVSDPSEMNIGQIQGMTPTENSPKPLVAAAARVA